ncbi:MAG: ABC transporter ATP-binding protein, partial [Nitrososphaerota archaeon]|nr:ABC transporter ATP-binding protein [Nitrososphaerota archaeon]
MRERIIEVEQLFKKYGHIVAVDHISFSVDRGQVFALLGPNGAGKTTTVEILECLRRPTSGLARVFGLDVSKPREAREIRRRIGVLPQDFKGLDKLTVKENIVFFAKLYPAHLDVDELMEVVGLSEWAGQRFETLSGGLKQRVGLAAAIVNDPELVFLDEPTVGLDPRSRRETWKVIRRFAEAGKTIFFTTHYMEEAEQLADKILIINRGRIVAEGSPEELIERYGEGRRLILRSAYHLKSELERLFGQVHQSGLDIVIPFKSLSELNQVLTSLRDIGEDLNFEIRGSSLEDVFL